MEKSLTARDHYLPLACVNFNNLKQREFTSGQSVRLHYVSFPISGANVRPWLLAFLVNYIK